MEHKPTNACIMFLIELTHVCIPLWKLSYVQNYSNKHGTPEKKRWFLVLGTPLWDYGMFRYWNMFFGIGFATL